MNACEKITPMNNRQFNLPTSSIEFVRFRLAGARQIEKDSFVTVRTSDQYKAGKPYANGVNDAHMGTIDDSYKCATCYNRKRNCLGHPGMIILRYPVWNPLMMKDISHWLKLLCFECGYPVVAESVYMRFPRGSRLNLASKQARTVKNCPRPDCNAAHADVKKAKDEPLLFQYSYTGENSTGEPAKIHPAFAENVFAKVPTSVVANMGRNADTHPTNLTLRVLQVPPTPIRPDVKKIGSGRSTNNELTTMIQIIVKKNDAIPSVIPPVISDAVSALIMDLNNAVFDFIKAGGEATTSIGSRIKGKQGHVRKNQLGKRTFNTNRSTIAGDPSLAIDQIGMPLKFARINQIKEIVQDYNRARLQTAVQNGRKRYPGASKVVKKLTGKECSPESGVEIELENGDEVHRDIVDDDPVDFNRQPSLMMSNISTHRVKVTPVPWLLTHRMNVIICPYYNADFDGDQMNMIINADAASRNELSMISAVPNWFISHMNSSPSIGQVDDSVIGTAELTRSGVKFSKYAALLLFAGTSITPDFDGEQTSRDCITLALAETPVNFTRTPEWYQETLAPYIKYKQDEIKVVIEQGKHVSGILDKKSIGKGANGGLYHIIASDYGPQAALRVMHNMQLMAINYIMQFGYTIGINDLLLPMSAKNEIDKISSDIINGSKLISEELYNGEIIPPIGKTVGEFFEERQINALSSFDAYVDPIMRAVNPSTNNLLKLVLFGSKGKLNNMFNMISAIGQKLINGERINQKFGYKRTLAYFPRFDTSPEARGYIKNSYVSGMDSAEFVFNAMAARFDLISKALSTSVTGEQNRKSIKSLESILINNHHWAIKGTSLIQLAYGGDFMDPRRIERVKFPTVMISDADLAEKYHHEEFPEFNAAITADRDKYRAIFLQLERMNIKESISEFRMMPIDLDRSITGILREHAGKLAASAPTPEVLHEMVGTVNNLCDSIPYLVLGAAQEKKRARVPKYVLEATWLMCMLVRSHLHPRALVTRKITPGVLKLICERVRLKYLRGLVDPGTAAGIIAAQSFSEPLTQYMLDAHHRSASGGTSNSGMTQTKEVLGAKDIQKMAAPTMVIPVLPEHAHNRARVQEIANGIEMMNLRQFVVATHIFYENYGKPVHSMFAHEADMIKKFAQMNPLLAPPSNLLRWCIRFQLSKTAMILKNMPLESIVSKLRETHQSTYIVYTAENAADIIIRVYVRQDAFKASVGLGDIIYFKDELYNTIIRGVDGITVAKVVELIRNKIDSNGAIVRDKDLYGIETTGSNLRGVLSNKYVDKLNVLSDSVQEVRNTLGISAAWQRNTSRMRDLVSGCNHRHYTIYSSEMVWTGNVTSIESSGLRTRESNNILLHIGFSSPMGAIENAVANSVKQPVSGITDTLLLGSIPKLGTIYNQVVVNTEFVAKNVKRVDELIDTLLM